MEENHLGSLLGFTLQVCCWLCSLPSPSSSEAECVDATESKVMQGSQWEIMDINYTAGTAEWSRFYNSLLSWAS